MTNRYVYGIVNAEDDDLGDFETEPVGGGDGVYTISHRRLAAVVSDIETTNPERTDEDARRHDELLREVMEASDRDDESQRTVVPMQFGMVFESDRALKNVIRGGRPAFRRTMNDIEGTVELGLKLVREEGTDVDKLEVLESVDEELEGHFEDFVDNGLFSDRLVMNRSYLVDNDDRGAFGDAVDRLEDEYDELLVQYTGPFAPYSFVDVHIGAQ